MFVGTGRSDDQLIPRKLVETLQVLSDQAANQSAFDVERPGLRAFVDVIPAIRGFVSALRVLNGTCVAAAGIAVHHPALMRTRRE
jgi:hypothetical protein